MKTIILHSNGKNDIQELIWEKPDITDNQIEVMTVYSGICRSDIGVYGGFEKPMPVGMFGHEGLGVVNKIGKNITDVKVGDFVATISDPSYGYSYNATYGQYVKVPELTPKYIVQPTACAMNIINKTLAYSYGRLSGPILLLGTGFMSIIIAQYCLQKGIELVVCGNSNKEIWAEMGILLRDINQLSGKYGAVIDLSSKASNFYLLPKLADVEATICYAATPFTPVTTNFFENCWNCHTFIMPSPRSLDFHQVMKKTVSLIEEGIISPEQLWSQEYSRSYGYKDAFEDGLKRIPGYVRGFFTFRG